MEKASRLEWENFYRDEIEYMAPTGIDDYLKSRSTPEGEIRHWANLAKKAAPPDVEAAIRKRTNDNLRSVFG